jgi:hypothetical protein
MITIMPAFSIEQRRKLLINSNQCLPERSGGETFAMLMCENTALLRFI